MPKAAERRTIETKLVDGVNLVTYEVDVKQDEKVKQAQYTVPATLADFQALVSKLENVEKIKDGEREVASPLATIFQRFMYGVDVAARQDVRESIASDSTVIKRDGKDVDVLKMDADAVKALRKACASVNAAFMLASSTGWDGDPENTAKGSGAPQRAFIVAREKLIEGVEVEFGGAKVTLKAAVTQGKDATEDGVTTYGMIGPVK